MNVHFELIEPHESSVSFEDDPPLSSCLRTIERFNLATTYERPQLGSSTREPMLVCFNEFENFTLNLPIT